MKTWQRALIVLTGSLLTCGPSRINKLPIPRERVLKGYRLMAEADKMLKEGKDHLAILGVIVHVGLAYGEGIAIGLL